MPFQKTDANEYTRDKYREIQIKINNVDVEGGENIKEIP